MSDETETTEEETPEETPTEDTETGEDTGDDTGDDAGDETGDETGEDTGDETETEETAATGPITVDGVEYIPISQDFYDELTAALEQNQQLRYGDVENFRAWCEAEKGTSTVEEGLRACTAKELYDYYYANTTATLSPVYNQIYRLYTRLTKRDDLRAAELDQTAVTPIMPPDDDETDAETGGEVATE